MSGKIVAVDDEESIRRLIQLALESEGFECRTAGDGQEGLSLIQEFEPQLILLDVMMPKMDGFELVEAVRADHNLKQPIIVMLSAKEIDMGTEYEKKQLPLIDEYLSKPFNLSELISLVKKHFGS